jgi:hypothetical protein
MGMEGFYEDLGRPLTLLNIYGLYQDKVPFWEALFKHCLIGVGSLIVNFSMGAFEVWGPKVVPDPL